MKIAEADVNKTMSILRSMTEEDIKKKQDAIAKVRSFDGIGSRLRQG